MTTVFPRTFHRIRRFAPVLGALLGVWALGAARHVFANDDGTQAKHPCAAVRADADRLACYDLAFGKPETPADKPLLPSEKFGFTPTQVERAKGETKEEPPPAERIEAEVTKVDYRPGGKFVATLANGQVWAQIEIDSRVRLAVGDVVTIRRAALGSYLLASPQGVATRAKRIR